MKASYTFNIVILCIIAAISFADETTPSSSGRRNIFKVPGETDVTQIKGTNTPWVKDEFVPTIQEFKKNFFEDLDNSPQAQKIIRQTFNSTIVRHIFFKLPNKFLHDIGHRAHCALANIVSKGASLFDPLTFPIHFETIAVNLAEFLLIHNIQIDRSSPTRYVNLLSSELDKVNDINDAEAVFLTTLNAYAGFATSYGFNLLEIIDEYLELWSSEIIVLHDK